MPEPEKTLLEVERQIQNLCRLSEDVIKNDPALKNNIPSQYYPLKKHCKVLTASDFLKEVVSGMSQSSYFGESEKHQELIEKWAEEKCAFMFPPTGMIFFKKEGWQTNAMRFLGIQNFNHELAHLFTNAKITKQEALTEEDKEYLRQERDWMDIDKEVLENLLPQITVCRRGLLKDYMLGGLLFCREGYSSAVNELYADIFGCHVQILALAHKNNVPYKDILSGMIQFEKIQAASLQNQPTRNPEEETVLQKCLSLLMALKYLAKTKKADELIIAGLKGDLEQFIAAGDKTFGQDIHRKFLMALAKNEYAAALKILEKTNTEK